MQKRRFFLPVLVVLAGLFRPIAAISSETQKETANSGDARFVGTAVCADCHQEAYANWKDSHHDLAMQVADGNTVLGDFDNAEFTHYGVTSTFYKKGDRFMVRTDGPDGSPQDYRIDYTFGVYPLQQYLIRFPGGRVQALGVAWDSRPRQEGGQRWFHLYPDEEIAYTDELHWTGPNQNWNYMCAECHSTDLQKRYDPATRTYDTTWAEINIGCEACHGPGSRHVGWAEQPERKGAPGLALSLDERRDVRWEIDPETGRPRRSVPRETQREIEMCGRCHARRQVITDQYRHGARFADSHVPALLDERLYHADGQVLEEVYVYGSFLQSRMFAEGVTCSDCHEPHSLALRVPGDGVCLQCHAAGTYQSSGHHHHEEGSAGASCIECHMPATTYMVVDPRHDHSLRIPQPELSVELGTPNACTRCHRVQTDEWAVRQMQKWYGRQPSGYQDFARALAAVRKGLPEAGQLLAELAADNDQPGIARATALSGLGAYLNAGSINVLVDGLYDDDPMLREAAARSLEGLDPAVRMKLAGQLLNDPVRAVRIQVARMLAATPPGAMNEEQGKQLDRAIGEYVAAQLANSDRPGSYLNLGVLYAGMGRFDEAEKAYRTALEVQPDFTQAIVNHADLYRQQGRDEEGERLLREGLEIAPQDADLSHALGLLLVRARRLEDALPYLGRAALRAPENTHYGYVYAVALHTSGQSEEAILRLEELLEQHPHDQRIRQALAAFRREAADP